MLIKDRIFKHTIMIRSPISYFKHVQYLEIIFQPYAPIGKKQQGKTYMDLTANHHLPFLDKNCMK